MEMIWGDDADKVDGIFPLALPLYHLFKICVGTVGADAVSYAGLPRSCRILTESSRDQFDGSIQLGRHAMHRADKRARATTHHPHAETSTLLIHLCLSPLLPGLASWVIFSRPYGTFPIIHVYPGLTSWATFSRPFGTGCPSGGGVFVTADRVG
jgi:hypothetical protein